MASYDVASNISQGPAWSGSRRVFCAVLPNSSTTPADRSLPVPGGWAPGVNGAWLGVSNYTPGV